MAEHEGFSRASDLAVFEAAPVARYVAGRTWALLCAEPGLWAVLFWGRPDREDAVQMTRAFAAELGPRVAPHVTLVDAQALDSIDAAAFQVLQDFARDHLEQSRSKVSRLALLAPQGMSGAVVAGFYGVLGPPFEVRMVDSRAEALLWLGHRLDFSLDEIMAEVRGTSPLLGPLRAHLLRHLVDPQIERAAEHLGLSVRTLQRRLTDAATTFADEVRAARIAEAERRLQDSDDPIIVIALELGYRSSQHFSRQFRQVRSLSPTAWRQRQRSGGRSPR